MKIQCGNHYITWRATIESQLTFFPVGPLDITRTILFVLQQAQQEFPQIKCRTFAILSLATLSHRRHVQSVHRLPLLLLRLTVECVCLVHESVDHLMMVVMLLLLLLQCRLLVLLVQMRLQVIEIVTDVRVEHQI